MFDTATSKSWQAPGLSAREPVVALHPREPLAVVGSYFDKDRNRVVVSDLVGNAPRATWALPNRFSHAAWSPDGRLLAVAEAHRHVIHLYDGKTFQFSRTIEGSGWGGAGKLSFNPAGDRLALVSWGFVWPVIDVETGLTLFRGPPRPGLGPHPRFSPDGTRLGLLSQEGRPTWWHVGDGREYRTFVRPNSPAVPAYYGRAAVSPQGRVLAVASRPNVVFWDLHTGSVLGMTRDDPASAYYVGQIPSTGDLLFPHPTGLLQCPWRETPGGAEGVRLGSPRSHTWGGFEGRDFCSSSRDGRVIIAGGRWHAIRLWDGAHPQGQTILRGADVHNAVVSPDGQWLVTLLHDSWTVEARELRSGGSVKRLAETVGLRSGLCFSSDGSYLAVGGQPGALFRVAGWERLRPLSGGAVAFSPDGRILAVELRNGIVRLERVEDGQELARLEPPELDEVGWVGFSPDGTKVITTSNGDNPGVHVWDLRRLREHLASMDLDWESEPFPSAPPAPQSPLRFVLDLGEKPPPRKPD